VIRVTLPAHLRRIAQTGEEVEIEVVGPITQKSVLDALEQKYPTLRGTVREYETGNRRPFLRFFAVNTDISHEDKDAALPPEVATGEEPFMIVGAIAGG
jgi:sulfur-carrier protein